MYSPSRTLEREEITHAIITYLNTILLTYPIEYRIWTSGISFTHLPFHMAGYISLDFVGSQTSIAAYLDVKLLWHDGMVQPATAGTPRKLGGDGITSKEGWSRNLKLRAMGYNPWKLLQWTILSILFLFWGQTGPFSGGTVNLYVLGRVVWNMLYYICLFCPLAQVLPIFRKTNIGISFGISKSQGNAS